MGNASVMKHIDIRTAYKSKLRLINIISYDSIGKAINNYVVVSQVSYVLINSYVVYWSSCRFAARAFKVRSLRGYKGECSACAHNHPLLNDSYIRNNAACRLCKPVRAITSNEEFTSHTAVCKEAILCICLSFLCIRVNVKCPFHQVP